MLEEALAADHVVTAPVLPHPPSYAAWTAVLEDHLRRLGDGAMLVGHSLGGSVLLKHLTQSRGA
ncbi:MAG TPA: alpha/beta hydrolase [Haliangiales bacterium]|nr:alpha/beta hydrolase [Haliangiales bacterium]